jgi:hypothetical protein
MPLHHSEPTLSPVERRRQVAAILAKGVVRLRRTYQTRGFTHAPESLPNARNCLEFPGETRLSVVNGTRGFTPRDDGDDA